MKRWPDDCNHGLHEQVTPDHKNIHDIVRIFGKFQKLVDIDKVSKENVISILLEHFTMEKICSK